jgi:hypothetical protein
LGVFGAFSGLRTPEICQNEREPLYGKAQNNRHFENLERPLGPLRTRVASTASPPGVENLSPGMPILRPPGGPKNGHFWGPKIGNFGAPEEGKKLRASRGVRSDPGEFSRVENSLRRGQGRDVGSKNVTFLDPDRGSILTPCAEHFWPKNGQKSPLRGHS